MEAHPTPQRLFTDTDLGGHVSHRPARLNHQAGGLLPKLRSGKRRKYTLEVESWPVRGVLAAFLLRTYCFNLSNREPAIRAVWCAIRCSLWVCYEGLMW